MKQIVEGDTNHYSYKMFSDDEKLQSIAKMTREIEGSGYTFRANNKKYALDRKLKELSNNHNIVINRKFK